MINQETCIFYQNEAKICVHPKSSCYLKECHSSGPCPRISYRELTKEKSVRKDIVCPDCKGMLEDTETTSLYCPRCNVTWRV